MISVIFIRIYDVYKYVIKKMRNYVISSFRNLMSYIEKAFKIKNIRSHSKTILIISTSIYITFTILKHASNFSIIKSISSLALTEFIYFKQMPLFWHLVYVFMYFCLITTFFAFKMASEFVARRNVIIALQPY